MDRAGVRYVIGTDQLSIVQEDRSITAGYENRVSVLTLDQVAVCEIGRVVRACQTVARYRRQK